MKKRLYIAPLTLLAGSLVLAQAGKQTAQPAGQANSASSAAKSEALKTIDRLIREPGQTRRQPRKNY